MKKKLLMLTLIGMSTTANAAVPQKMSDASIKDAIEYFHPAFCKGVKEATQAIQSCYNSNKSTDPKVDKCILADLSIYSSIANGNKKREALGKPPLFKDITFLSDASFEKRYEKYIKPRVQLVNNKPMFAYYKPAGPIFTNAVISHCNGKGQ